LSLTAVSAGALCFDVYKVAEPWEVVLALAHNYTDVSSAFQRPTIA
jgi:hypothetical protein